MSIKSLLVAFSGDAASCSALRLAMAMSRKYGAHLTGVVWHGPHPIESRYRAYLNRDVVEILAKREAEEIAAIEADFRSRVDSAGLADWSEFLDLQGVSDFSLAERARGYDIVVISRQAAEAGREHFSVRPDVIALRSGRPVIVVPPDYASDILNEHALVAWDGKRAAARALGDAMHILETKSRVTVLTVGDPEDNPSARGDDVMALLARHAIPAERLVKPAGRNGIARTILDSCREVGAGLLVMGAYEHSKFSEDLLGGVTRDILGQSELPILMSH
jgi:nucleotide-binding universal stress UspA family protein